MKNIDEVGNIHAYVTQGEREVSFKKVKEEPEKDLTVRVHYKRLYNDYKNWNVWAWENNLREKIRMVKLHNLRYLTLHLMIS